MKTKTVTRGQRRLSGLLAAAPLALWAADPIHPAAWQAGDERLAAKWQQLTGKFIFQQACSPCHKWGPAYWPRHRWADYFEQFSENHQPDVRDRYKDLTAMFDVGKAVPTLAQEQEALAQFVLAAAPATEVAKAEREKPLRAFPEVGSPAPDFAVTDVQGRKFAPSDLKDRRALVLVFSRAHW
ncbi:MAG: hypothetical protein HYY24_01475 [Verrucomicrobia bacterium]|nr:hypothetical protein [Verrucomicrobiota bacterium]